MFRNITPSFAPRPCEAVQGFVAGRFAGLTHCIAEPSVEAPSTIEPDQEIGLAGNRTKPPLAA